MTILSTSLKHGFGYYYYKVERNKLRLLQTQYDSLSKFLLETQKTCPDHIFHNGPRSSTQRIQLDTDIQHTDHLVTYLAQMGLETDYYGNAHMNVQMFMLAYDNNTIAMEVPVWMQRDEHPRYEHIFNTEKPLSGHVDVLRVEDDKIWIWDYKPNAHREKYADVQTYLYALMLSKRANIPLAAFRCGYFDDKNAYVFRPDEATILTQ